jgi:hypothetical protein
MRRTLEGGTGGSNGRLIRTLPKRGGACRARAHRATAISPVGCGWGHAGLVLWEQRFARPIRRTAELGRRMSCLQSGAVLHPLTI